MKILEKIVWSVSKRARQKRAEIFRQNFKLNKTTKILDIGSENGENINRVLGDTEILPNNVFIADIDAQVIKSGREKFGFQSVLLDETGTLPFADNFFDIVYCSSVIEHTTASKERVWEISSEKEFQKTAWEKQKFLAKEIERVGKAYFVQTPSKNFPIESHTWLPMFSYLPRPLQIKILRLSNKYWIKKSLPDFNLLNSKDMRKLFPEAKIIFEKKFGLVKSIIAIKN